MPDDQPVMRHSWVWQNYSLLVLLALVLTSVRWLREMGESLSRVTMGLLVVCLIATIHMIFRTPVDVKLPFTQKPMLYPLLLAMVLIWMALSYTLLLHLVWLALN